MYDPYPKFIPSLGGFDEPGPDEVVWRYMSLEAYLDLIISSELHMARVDTMEDPWEGYVGAATEAARRRRYENYDFMASRGIFAMWQASQRRWSYISCWHAAQYESAAMWSLYGAGKGVAVQSTWQRLTSSLEDATSRVLGARVKYVDYDVYEAWDGVPFGLILCKRLSFEHEREVRLISMLEPPLIPGSGISRPPGARNLDAPSPAFDRIKTDLTQMVNAVYLAPQADDWVLPIVKAVTQEYGHTWDIFKSNLYTLS